MGMQSESKSGMGDAGVSLSPEAERLCRLLAEIILKALLHERQEEPEKDFPDEDNNEGGRQ